MPATSRFCHKRTTHLWDKGHWCLRTLLANVPVKSDHKRRSQAVSWGKSHTYKHMYNDFVGRAPSLVPPLTNQMGHCPFSFLTVSCLCTWWRRRYLFWQTTQAYLMKVLGISEYGGLQVMPLAERVLPLTLQTRKEHQIPSDYR